LQKGGDGAKESRESKNRQLLLLFVIRSNSSFFDTPPSTLGITCRLEPNDRTARGARRGTANVRENSKFAEFRNWVELAALPSTDSVIVLTVDSRSLV
jgi:hypothetical protein